MPDPTPTEADRKAAWLDTACIADPDDREIARRAYLAGLMAERVRWVQTVRAAKRIAEAEYDLPMRGHLVNMLGGLLLAATGDESIVFAEPAHDPPPG